MPPAVVPAPAPRAPRAARLRLALLLGLLAAGACAVLVLDPRRLLEDRAAALAGEPWGAPVFAVLYALGTLLLVPKPALSALAGVLFGPGQGLWVAAAGTTLGALLGFLAVRHLGRAALRPYVRGGALAGLDRRLTERGAWGVLVLRLVPVAPFAAVTGAAALSGVGAGGFVLATAVGTLPGNAVYVLAGAAAVEPASWTLWAPPAACAVLLGGAWWWRRSGRGRRASRDQGQ